MNALISNPADCEVRGVIRVFAGGERTKRYEAYLEIKRKTKRIIIVEKNEMWDRKCQQINAYIGGRKCTEAWKFI